MLIRFVGFALISVLLATVAWQMTVPMVPPDEIGYLAAARYIAKGEVMSMANSTYYYFGQGILLAPWFLLFDSSEIIYRASVLQSSVVTALIFPVLVSLGSRIGFVSDWKAYCAAGLATLWPAYLYDAFLSWPEATFRLSFLLMLLCFVSAWHGRSRLWWWLVVVAAVTCFALHPKGLAVPFVAIAALFVGAALGRMPKWTFVTGAALAAAGWLSVRYLNGMFREAIWVEALPDGRRISGRIELLTSLPAFARMIAVASGQSWYAIASTAGLALVGLWALFKWNRSLWVFATVAASTVLAASVLQMMAPIRIDHVIYGRYFAGVTSVFLWVGIYAALAGYLQNESISLRIIPPILLIALAAPAVFVILDGSLRGLNYQTIPSMLAMRTLAVEYGDVASIIFGGSILAVISYILIVTSPVTALVTMFIFIGIGSNAIVQNVFHLQNARKAQAIGRADIISQLGSSVDWHRSAWGDPLLYLTQYSNDIFLRPIDSPSWRPFIASSNERFDVHVEAGPLTQWSSVFVSKSEVSAIELAPSTIYEAATLKLDHQGWQPAENWGVWSRGHSGRLVFDVPQMANPTLQLLVFGLVQGPITSQRVTVTVVNGERSEWTLSGEITLKEIELVAGRNVIEFEFHDAATPASLGMGGDNRTLAMAIARLCLTEAGQTCLK